MIRIIITTKNGEVTRMEVEGGDALPKFIKTNQAACAWLIEDQGRDPATPVTFRNIHSQHDSFKPAAVGAWATKTSLFQKQAKPAAEQIKAAFADQALPKRPKAGTLCAKVWDMMDELGNVSNAEAIAAGMARGLNAGNVRVEASNWRKYQAIKAARA